jgi:hypothetical protein
MSDNNAGKIALQHTRLSARSRGVNPLADAIATRVADEGGSPRAQIDAARTATGQRLNYSPHQGLRERERRLARQAKNETP